MRSVARLYTHRIRTDAPLDCISFLFQFPPWHAVALEFWASGAHVGKTSRDPSAHWKLSSIDLDWAPCAHRPHGHGAGITLPWERHERMVKTTPG